MTGAGPYPARRRRDRQLRLSSGVSPGMRAFQLPFLLGAALGAAAFLPASVAAQGSAIVDEGTFTVTQKGAPLGRESFRVLRAAGPGGQVFLATGTSALGNRRLTSSLGTDSTGVPVSYESTESVDGELAVRVLGRGRPGRLSVVKQTTTGESAREYRLNNGALLLDEDIFHHFFFVAAAGHKELIAIAPRPARESRYRVEARGEERVVIADRSLAARRIALVPAASGVPARDLWVDGRGRLLKVAAPDRDLIALRDDPPR